MEKTCNLKAGDVVNEDSKIFDNWQFATAMRHKRNVEHKIGIREASLQIGISSATLSRVENCKMPDLITYWKCCKWLNIAMDSFFIEYTY